MTRTVPKSKPDSGQITIYYVKLIITKPHHVKSHSYTVNDIFSSAYSFPLERDTKPAGGCEKLYTEGMTKHPSVKV